MDRRRAITLVGGVMLSTVLAGCLGSDEEETDDEEINGGETYREVETSEHLVVDRDSLQTEDGTAYVSVEIRNTAETAKYATVRLQMRDTDGESIGSEYSQTDGPIEPEAQTQFRFDIDETPEQVGGYRIDITEERA